MEENTILDESVNVVNEAEDTRDESPKIQPRKNKNQFKEKTCNVIRYDKSRGILDVSFDGYGIRFHDIKDFSAKTAVVKYKGEIGKPNFEYKL